MQNDVSQSVETPRRRKRTLSVRKYKVSRDGSMKLISRQDTLSDHQSSEKNLPLSNYKEVASVLSAQSARNAETERLRTERKHLLRGQSSNSQQKILLLASNTEHKDKKPDQMMASCTSKNLDFGLGSSIGKKNLACTTRRSLRRKHVSYFRIFPEESFHHQQIGQQPADNRQQAPAMMVHQRQQHNKYGNKNSRVIGEADNELEESKCSQSKHQYADDVRRKLHFGGNSAAGVPPQGGGGGSDEGG